MKTRRNFSTAPLQSCIFSAVFFNPNYLILNDFLRSSGLLPEAILPFCIIAACSCSATSYDPTN